METNINYNGGLMISELSELWSKQSGELSSGVGPGRRHCVVFLGKTH